MADARLQVTIDAVDNASAQINHVEQQFTHLGREMRRVGVAMGLVGGAIAGGLALAVKSTEEGKAAFERLGRATEPVKQAISDALVPAINTLTTILRPLLKGLADFIETHKTVVVVVGAFAVGLALLGTVLISAGVLVSAYGVIVHALGTEFAVMAIKAAAAWLAAIAPAALAIGVFIAAEHAATVFFRRVGTIPPDTKSVWEKLGGTIGDVVRHFTDGLVPAADAVARSSSNASHAVDMLTASLKAAADAEREMQNVAKGFERTGFHGLGTDTEAFLEKIAGSSITSTIAELTKAGMGLKAAWDVAVSKALSDAEAHMEEVAKTMQNGAAIMVAYRAHVISLADAWGLLGGKIETALSKLREPIGTVASTMDAQVQAIRGGAGTLFGSFAGAAAQRFEGGYERLQAFQAGERSPDLMLFIRTLARLVAIEMGSDPEFSRGRIGEFFTLNIDGRTVASILGSQALNSQAVRSS